MKYIIHTRAEACDDTPFSGQCRDFYYGKNGRCISCNHFPEDIFIDAFAYSSIEDAAAGLIEAQRNDSPSHNSEWVMTSRIVKVNTCYPYTNN